MAKAKGFHSWEVKSFSSDNTYPSAMILDNIITGEPTVEVDQGTLKGSCGTPGGNAHKHLNIFHIKGGATPASCDKKYNVKQGSPVVIPGKASHALQNESQTEDFVLLTFYLSCNTPGSHYVTCHNFCIQLMGENDFSSFPDRQMYLKPTAPTKYFVKYME